MTVNKNCTCGVCAMLAECRKPATQIQQIADKEMLQKTFDFCDNLFNDDPTRKPLPALSPLHETFRNNVWGRGAFRNTLLPGSWR